jgi:phosphate transport system substrate-binding protein
MSVRKIAAACITLLGAASPSLADTVASGGQISGAGASFPAPLYKAWIDAYGAAEHRALSYEAVGSGAGVQRIEAGTVDFGGTDKPVTPEDLEKNGLIQFPTVLGGVAPVVNMPGIDSETLHLDGPLLADIFAGKVKKWNDPRIQAQNPGLALTDWPITVVHRADKSGTTFLFTSYLSAVSPDYKAEHGASDTGTWPKGLEGVGNSAVPDIMKGTLGTIGYVEFYYAKTYHLDTVVLKNRDGVAVSPTTTAFSAAAAHADWSKAKGFALLLLDQPGAGSWPITGATFVLVRKDAPVARREAVLNFVDWSWRHGDATADQLNYVPLPAEVKALVRTSWGAEAPPAP